MSLARILTPWLDNRGSGSTCDFQLVHDHPPPAGTRVTDVTGQPVANITPTPNLLTVEASGYSAAWLTAVQGDATYTILWSQ